VISARKIPTPYTDRERPGNNLSGWNVGRTWYWISSLSPEIDAITELAVIAAASFAYPQPKAIDAATESIVNAEVKSQP
jgi:hypothetical protein